MEFTEKNAWRIYNIDEKRARFYYFIREEIVVSIGVKEIYVGILENYILVTIIKNISANRKFILLVIIVLRKMIISNWFYENMKGNEVVIVFIFSYINNDIYNCWLNYFI